jgi:hypothetical protein
MPGMRPVPSPLRQAPARSRMGGSGAARPMTPRTRAGAGTRAGAALRRRHGRAGGRAGNRRLRRAVPAAAAARRRARATAVPRVVGFLAPRSAVRSRRFRHGRAPTRMPLHGLAIHGRGGPGRRPWGRRRSRPARRRGRRGGRGRPHRSGRRRRKQWRVQGARGAFLECVGAGRDGRQGRHRRQPDEQRDEHHVPPGRAREALGAVDAVEAFAHDLERRHESVIVVFLRHGRPPPVTSGPEDQRPAIPSRLPG